MKSTLITQMRQIFTDNKIYHVGHSKSVPSVTSFLLTAGFSLQFFEIGQIFLDV